MQVDPRERSEGRTPLLVAVIGGHTEAISTLIDLGANIETRDHVCFDVSFFFFFFYSSSLLTTLFLFFFFFFIYSSYFIILLC